VGKDVHDVLADGQVVLRDGAFTRLTESGSRPSASAAPQRFLAQMPG